MIVESRQNSQYKTLKKLKEKKYRDKMDLFYVEGLRLTEEGLLSGHLLEQLIISENNLEKYQEIIQSHGEVILILKEELFGELSDTENSQGILGVFQKQRWEIPDDFSKEARCLFLDRIQDPGNMGTILRSADAFGIDAIFVNRGCVDLYNPKVLRATMGAIFHSRIYQVEEDFSFVQNMKEKGFLCYGLSPEANKNIETVEKNQRICLVVGNEGNGIKEDLKKEMDDLLSIHMKGKAESLNAAVAAAIALYALS